MGWSKGPRQSGPKWPASSGLCSLLAAAQVQHTEEEWLQILGPAAYKVMREEGTERAGTRWALGLGAVRSPSQTASRVEAVRSPQDGTQPNNSH